jgi:hypothetical protein
MAGKVSWGLGLNVEFWGEKGDSELDVLVGGLYFVADDSVAS